MLSVRPPVSSPKPGTPVPHQVELDVASAPGAGATPPRPGRTGSGPGAPRSAGRRRRWRRRGPAGTPRPRRSARSRWSKKIPPMPWPHPGGATGSSRRRPVSRPRGRRRRDGRTPRRATDGSRRRPPVHVERGEIDTTAEPGTGIGDEVAKIGVAGGSVRVAGVDDHRHPGGEEAAAVVAPPGVAPGQPLAEPGGVAPHTAETLTAAFSSGPSPWSTLVSPPPPPGRTHRSEANRAVPSTASSRAHMRSCRPTYQRWTSSVSGPGSMSSRPAGQAAGTTRSPYSGWCSM